MLMATFLSLNNGNKLKKSVSISFLPLSNYYKFSGLKQLKFIILTVLEVRKMKWSHWAKIKMLTELHSSCRLLAISTFERLPVFLAS